MKIEIKDQINEKHIMKKNKDKLLQKQNDRFIHFKEIVRTCVDLENRFEAMKEKCSINDSKNILNFYQRNLFKTT